MAEKPPLVVVVEAALRAPARWVQYTPYEDAVPATEPAAESLQVHPLVAEVEEALEAPVVGLRYLPSYAELLVAFDDQDVAAVAERSADDEPLLAAVEAVLRRPVLSLRYLPSPVQHRQGVGADSVRR